MNDAQLKDFIVALDHPTREADCLIAELLDDWRTPENRVTYYGEPTGEHVDPEDGRFIACRAFTGSVDDALTFRPKDSQWSFDSHYNIATINLYHSPSCAEDTGFDSFSSEGSTAALALCGAILLARAG